MADLAEHVAATIARADECAAPFAHLDTLDDSVAERNSLMLTYYLDSGVLGRVRNRVKRVANLVAHDARRLLRAA